MFFAFSVCGFPLHEQVSGGAHAVGETRSVGLQVMSDMRRVAVAVVCSAFRGISG